MLKIVVKSTEHYDEDKNMFFKFPAKDTQLTLEHSLLSISKWEEKWHRPFLNDEQLTDEQTLDYIRCMCVNPSSDNVDMMLLLNLSQENVKAINEYIANEMTATFFNDNEKKKSGKRIITNELIYYWMTAYQIPFTCEKWHINKLLTLIKVCNAENEAANKSSKVNPKKPPKMSKSQIASRDALNAKRKAALHSRG